jgi:hypothetical protein
MFPIIFPVASPDLAVRVQQLENALALSLELVHTLLKRLEFKLGSGFLGEELERLIAAQGPTAKDEARRIDALVEQGQQPKAARHFRELAGVTWDQAHDIIGRWGSYSFEQKVRHLQIAVWVKALSAQFPLFGSGAQRGQIGS